MFLSHISFIFYKNNQYPNVLHFLNHNYMIVLHHLGIILVGCPIALNIMVSNLIFPNIFLLLYYRYLSSFYLITIIEKGIPILIRELHSIASQEIKSYKYK